MLLLCASVSHSVMSDSLPPHGLYLARLLYPWNSLGKSTGVGSHSLLQGIFLTLSVGRIFIIWPTREGRTPQHKPLLLLLLSHFSRVRLCATPWTAAHQAPLSMEFSRQEYWSGLPFPFPDWTCTDANYFLIKMVKKIRTGKKRKERKSLTWFLFFRTYYL